ncbi:hypothetical protein A2U01_0054371, partial [Trifolium medium]|nr:hypothetical protein [Trifolium medium]
PLVGTHFLDIIDLCGVKTINVKWRRRARMAIIITAEKS